MMTRATRALKNKTFSPGPSLAACVSMSTVEVPYKSAGWMMLLHLHSSDTFTTAVQTSAAVQTVSDGLLLLLFLHEFKVKRHGEGLIWEYIFLYSKRRR
jgi:hypothetical protein